MADGVIEFPDSVRAVYHPENDAWMCEDNEHLERILNLAYGRKWLEPGYHPNVAYSVIERAARELGAKVIDYPKDDYVPGRIY